MPTIRNESFDGLRAVAVLLVIGYHAGVPFLKGGFVGVELFFVLSGFLITSVLCREFERGSVSLPNFWWRRFLRLFPALCLLVFCVVLTVLLFRGNSWGAIIIDGLTALTYTTNLFRMFDAHEPNLLLGHTWSLGIEWQFYMVWPVLFYFSMKRGFSLAELAVVALSIASLVVLWRLVLSNLGASFSRVYFGVDSKIDGIMLGTAMALLLSGADGKTLEAAGRYTAKLAVPVLVLLVFLAFTARLGDSFEYGYICLLANIVGVVLVADLHLNPRGMVAAFLSAPGLVFLGGISYGVYLWHYPIFRFLLEVGIDRSFLIASVGGALSIIAAHLSFHYVEEPVIKAFSGRPPWVPHGSS